MNPIEELWRWLRQKVIHRHRRADQWKDLKAAAMRHLDAFADIPAGLLRYVGLLPLGLTQLRSEYRGDWSNRSARHDG